MAATKATRIEKLRRELLALGGHLTVADQRHLMATVRELAARPNPPAPAAGPTTRRTFRVPDVLWTQVTAATEAEDTDASKVVNSALQDYVDGVWRP